MMKLLILALTITTCVLPALAFFDCDRQDKAALLRIRRELGNPQLSPTGMPPPTAVVDGRASFASQSPKLITISHILNLSGTIPNTLTKLTNLGSLYISHISVSDSIPDFLSSIKTLDFSYNKLSGPLLASFSLLPNLSTLDLRNLSLSSSS
ncbi:hypothetical protein PIB30_052837 [Stylosanthes scabra]|uniref:Uncharacterized protein n=1 Tax=Stylosanthes scabra TaxID=79078 RepID=A0ABU6RIE4_9FABA|nr:hypothetical protein [Stylosanthes scabra]